MSSEHGLNQAQFNWCFMPLWDPWLLTAHSSKMYPTILAMCTYMRHIITVWTYEHCMFIAIRFKHIFNHTFSWIRCLQREEKPRLCTKWWWGARNWPSDAEMMGLRPCHRQMPQFFEVVQCLSSGIKQTRRNDQSCHFTIALIVSPFWHRLTYFDTRKGVWNPVAHCEKKGL